MGCNDSFSKNYLNWCLKWLCEEEEGPTISCDVGYIYRLEGTSTVTFPDNTSIAFQGAILRGSINFQIISPTDILINSTGVYKVTYYLNCNSRSIVTLRIIENGNPRPLSSIYTYKNNTASSAIYGQGLIEITAIPAILRLYVLKSVTLETTQQNEAQSVNASVLIKKVCQS